VLPREVDEFVRPGGDGALFRTAGHGDAATAAELQQPFVAEDAQRPQDCVRVDAENGGEIARRRQPLAGLRLTLRDRPAELSGNLLVEVGRLVPIDLDAQHGASNTSSIVSPVEELDAPPRSAPPADDVEALIEEARRRTRKRRLVYAALILTGAAVGLVAAFAGGGGHAGSPTSGPAPRTPPPRSAEQRVIERAAKRATLVASGLLAPRMGWAMNGLNAWLTLDGGAHWRAIAPPHVRSMGDAVARITQIEFPDTRDGWISATDLRVHDYEERHGEIDRTTDGGRTWQTVTPHDRLPIAGAQLSFLDAHRGFALTVANRRIRLYRTADGGVTWSLVGAPPFNGTIVFLNQHDGLGAMRNLYRTADGGRHWERVTLPVPPRYAGLRTTVDLPAFFGARDGVASARVLDPKTKAQHVVVYVTHDGGATWSARPAPAAADVRAYTFGFSGGTPFSAASADDWKLMIGRALYTTRDAGVHWSVVRARYAPKPPTVWDVQFTSASAGWAIFGVGDGAALVGTTNGGRDWTPVHPPAMRFPKKP
jgi:photosystem II stability/assembly factor-like uncharacterized protein